MNNDKPTCSFKDLIIENDIVKCEICGTVISSKPKEVELIEEKPDLEF